MFKTLTATLVVVGLIAATSMADNSFTQYNATLYLYQNSTPLATWAPTPFTGPPVQVLWHPPTEQFLMIFADSNVYSARVMSDASLSFSLMPDLYFFDGVAKVFNQSHVFFVGVWGSQFTVQWCNEALNCTRFNFPVNDGFVPITAVNDIAVVDLNTVLVGTNAGLLYITFSASSSASTYVPLHNTTGSLITWSFVSKVHVRPDGSALVATKEFHTTVNCWTTDLVHVVDGITETYFYRTPGIIDARPTAFIEDPARQGVHMPNAICDNILFDNGTLLRVGGANEGGLPQGNLTSGDRSTVTGNIWMGAELGLVMLRPDGSWKYFFGPRWLPGQGFTDGMHVIDLAAGSNPSDGTEVVLVATDNGLSLIFTISWPSLDEKSAMYNRKMGPFLRYGLVSQLQLNSFGDTSQATQTTTANDGLWSSIFLGSQIFRFAATGDEEARTNAWNTFNGMQLLVNVTGDLGYPARSFIFQSNVSAPCPSGLYPSPTMSGFCWQGDTSSDEITGHLHIYPLMYYHVAKTTAEKDLVKATIVNILGGIVRNNFTLVGAMSKHKTTWGRWDPEDLNDDPFWYDERGVNSNQILTYLVNAFAITEMEVFRDAFNFLVDEHHYDVNLIDLKITQPTDINWSDDELTFLPYLSFLGGKTFANGTLNPLYQRISKGVWRSIYRSHQFVMKAKPSLYNAVFVAAAMELAEMPLDHPEIVAAVSDAVWWMQTYTVWQVDWPINNMNRLDAEFPKGSTFHHTWTLFPYDELSILRWNANPFTVTQGSGYSEQDPSPFLYAFWVGRYYRLW